MPRAPGRVRYLPTPSRDILRGRISKVISVESGFLYRGDTPQNNPAAAQYVRWCVRQRDRATNDRLCTMKHLTLLFLCLLLAAPVAAQQDTTATTAEAETTSEDCAPDLEQDVFAGDPFGSGPPAEAAAPSEALTAAEQRVQDIIAQDGVHVVHFWAPWCPNSMAELKMEENWADLVAANEDVTFTFVTIWNDDESAAETLAAYDVPADRVTELTQPDYGPSDDKSQRRRAFLGLPVTWIPSTWIFHQNGELAFALNYGEMSMETIQHLLDATQADWSH